MSSLTRPSPRPLERRDIAAAVATAITLAALAGAVRFAIGPLSQPRFPVVGSLVYDGLPAAGAQIALFPREKPPCARPIATAVVRADGSFRAATLGLADGVPPGRYVVTLTWQPPTIRGEELLPGDNILPAEYAQPSETPLAIEVRAERNDLGRLLLRSVPPGLSQEPNPRWEIASRTPHTRGVFR